jgi:cytidine deaminase
MTLEDSELITLATEARANAYAPYSQYAVGAALLTASGRVYVGCNVENASYGLTICAERTAAVKAVCDGQYEFVALAVVTESGVAPCGACRQVLGEFGPAMRILVADVDGSYREFALSELLPDHFGPSQLLSGDEAACG